MMESTIMLNIKYVKVYMAYLLNDQNFENILFC